MGTRWAAGQQRGLIQAWIAACAGAGLLGASLATLPDKLDDNSSQPSHTRLQPSGDTAGMHQDDTRFKITHLDVSAVPVGSIGQQVALNPLPGVEGPWAQRALVLLGGGLLACACVLLARRGNRSGAAHEALQASHVRLAATVASVPEGVLGVDLQGRLTHMNPAAEHLTGWPLAAAAGRPLETVFQPLHLHTRAVLSGMLQDLSGHPPRSLAALLPTRSGTLVPIHLVATPILDPQGQLLGAAVLVRDATQELQMEQQQLRTNTLLQRALEQQVAGQASQLAAQQQEQARLSQQLQRTQDHLLQAQKMELMGQLAGSVAHDFNNLLSVILGYVDAMAAEAEPGAPFLEDLTQVRGAASRAVDLTRQLMAFSREQAAAPQVCVLNDVLGRMEKLLGRLVGERVRLVWRGAEDLAHVCVDPSQWEQVVMNLVVNARDAMPDGGTVEVSTCNLEVDAALAATLGCMPGPHVQLSVVDTGVGMDPAVMPRIFEPFFTTKPPGRGTGLGLATVDGIVRRCGGVVRVTSQPGQGSRFDILVPACAAVPRDEDARVSLEPPAGGGETILLVEDEDVVRALVKRILGSAGYHVLDAADGAHALGLSSQFHGDIHLVLTDVVMPGMDGHQLVARLVDHRPGARVLFMSGYPEVLLDVGGSQGRGPPLMHKPAQRDVLLRAVRTVLETPPYAVHA